MTGHYTQKLTKNPQYVKYKTKFSYVPYDVLDGDIDINNDVDITSP